MVQWRRYIYIYIFFIWTIIWSSICRCVLAHHSERWNAIISTFVTYLHNFFWKIKSMQWVNLFPSTMRKWLHHWLVIFTQYIVNTIHESKIDTDLPHFSNEKIHYSRTQGSKFFFSSSLLILNYFFCFIFCFVCEKRYQKEKRKEKNFSLVLYFFFSFFFS
jgi:hypothetical protein